MRSPAPVGGGTTEIYLRAELRLGMVYPRPQLVHAETLVRCGQCFLLPTTVFFLWIYRINTAKASECFNNKTFRTKPWHHFCSLGGSQVLLIPILPPGTCREVFLLGRGEVNGRRVLAFALPRRGPVALLPSDSGRGTTMIVVAPI